MATLRGIPQCFLLVALHGDQNGYVLMSLSCAYAANLLNVSARSSVFWSQRLSNC